MSGAASFDIRLSEISPSDLDLLRELREDLLHQKPAICIERARLVTEYLRDMSSEDDDVQVRYARAVRHFLSRKEPLFFDGNRLAGTTTSHPLGAPVYPEFTGLTIWPELDTIGTREKNPIALSAADAEVLNHDVFPYWMDRSVAELTRRKFGNPECLKLAERIVFFIAGKMGCISHTIPDYSVVLNQGMEHLIDLATRKRNRARRADRRNFFEAIRIALEGVIEYSRRLSARAMELAAVERDLTRRENLLQMAEVCHQVPAKPARTFREAVNALWITQVGIHAENINMALSPGRLDQVLYPSYRRDMEEGRIGPREALELIGCLWAKLNDNTNVVPEAAEELFGGAGTVPAVTLGGVDGSGGDAVNELTFLMLRATEFMRTRDPSVNARYHHLVNSDIYRNRVAEVIARTGSVPAIHNDVADIATLENQGIAPEHARDYGIIGCVELGSAGRSYDSSSSIMLNLVSALEMALFDGRKPVTGNERVGPRTGDPAEFESIEDLRDAFRVQFEWLAGKAIELNEMLGRVHQETHPTPLLSALFEGPMDTGRDLSQGGARYNSSGATHIGFADTVDSLSAVEWAVFEKGVCTFSELQDALDADFEGHEELHAYLLHRIPRYGTDHPVAVRNSRWLIRLLYDFYQRHTNYRGGRYRPAYWTMTNHAGLGKYSGALPNGRRAGTPFASGITPVSQAATDLAACLKAVAGLDGLCIPGGEAFNLKYPHVDSAGDVEKLAQAVEAYFRMGGLQVQFNIMSYEMLMDARKHPDRYPDLLVRVSGYSAYFRDLSDAMKEEIITRTEYSLQTGRANPFPRDP